MALIYAARFPDKVRKLVLAGAPIDTDAQSSRFTVAAQTLSIAVFDELTRLGDSRMLGRRALELWEPALKSNDVAAALQVGAAELGRLARRAADSGARRLTVSSRVVSPR